MMASLLFQAVISVIRSLAVIKPNALKCRLNKNVAIKLTAYAWLQASLTPALLVVTMVTEVTKAQGKSQLLNVPFLFPIEITTNVLLLDFYNIHPLWHTFNH